VRTGMVCCGLGVRDAVITTRELVGRQVLVTGAGGFIGSHLVERLVGLGASVTALVRYNSRGDWGMLELLPHEVRSSVRVISGDLRDPDLMGRTGRGMHTVFHLGALIAIPYSYHSPRAFVETNVVGTLNVLNAVRDHDVARLMHTSTSEVYGTARCVPMTEDHPLQAQSPYAASKIGADKLVESYVASYDLPATIVRPFNTYGPRQSPRAVIPATILQALKGRSIRLGLLTPRRDFTYVSDTVEGFIRLALSDACRGQTVNLGSGEETSIADVVQLVAHILGVEIAVTVDEQRLRPQTSEVQRLLADARRARELAGWSPQVALRQGLEHTIAWFERERHRYKSDMYAI
jgi:NAD dependent epimerase/dehydratase